MFLRKKSAKTIIFTLAVTTLLSSTCFGLSNEAESNDSLGGANTISALYDLNSEINASISSGSDVDYYKFVPLESGGYTIETLGDLDTFGYIYGSNMTLLDQSDDQFYLANKYPFATVEEYKTVIKSKNMKLRCNLKANQTYFIKVTPRDTTNGAGQYRLKVSMTNRLNDEVEPNGGYGISNTISNVNTIPFKASIGIPNEVDYFNFTPDKSGTYIIESTGTTDTSGYVYNSQEAFITSGFSNGSDTNFKITCNLTANQKYYLKVTHSSTGTGDYSLKLSYKDALVADTQGNDFSTAVTLPQDYVSYPNMQINLSNDQDFYKFTPTNDGVYTFQSSGCTNTFGEVYDLNRNLLKSDMDSGVESNFKISLPLAKNKPYYLKVGSSNLETGSYNLSIGRGKILDVNQYVQLPYDQLCWATSSSMIASYLKGDNINRSLEMAYDRAKRFSTDQIAVYGSDFYKYSSVFNQPASLDNGGLAIRTYVDVTPTSYVNDSSRVGSAATPISLSYILKSIDNGYPIFRFVSTGTGSAHATVIKGYVYTPTGIKIVYNDPMDGKEHIEDLATTITTTSGFITLYPNFNVDLEPSNSFEEANRLNSSISTSILRPGDVDYYTFGTSGSTVYTIKTTGNIDTVGELYDSNKNLILKADMGGEGGNFLISKALNAQSIYYLKVYHKDPNATGNYTISLY